MQTGGSESSQLNMQLAAVGWHSNSKHTDTTVTHSLNRHQGLTFLLQLLFITFLCAGNSHRSWNTGIRKSSLLVYKNKWVHMKPVI